MDTTHYVLVSPTLKNGMLVLNPGTEYVIGRGSSATVELPSERVSRVHAHLRWSGDAFTLVDNGSKNGTLLNGTKINRPMRLKSDDVVTIGPFELEFQQTDRPLAELRREHRADDMETVSDSSGLKKMKSAGGLEGGQLLEYLRELGVKKKTGMIYIDSHGLGAHIALHQGNIVDAHYGRFYGLNAASRILDLSQGKYRFHQREVRTTGGLEKPVLEFLHELEGKRSGHQPIEEAGLSDYNPFS